MKNSIQFDNVTQNSILICKILMNPSKLPDYIFIHIEAKVITPVDSFKVLTSLPIFYEPKTDPFYFKCLIPHNALPSFSSEYYQIEYKLYLKEFKGNTMTSSNYKFIVRPNSAFNEYKYDIFLDSDMIRIDTNKNETETGFSKIVEFLRQVEIKTDNKSIIDRINEKPIIDHINEKPIIDRINDKLTKLTKYNQIFANIISDYANKGDLFYHIKNENHVKYKLIECEINNEQGKVILLKYGNIFKKKLEFEFNFVKNVYNIKIYLVRSLAGDKSEELIGEYKTGQMIFKKVTLKKTWKDFPIRTSFFEMKIYLKICVDDLSFNLYPIFV